MTKAVIQIISAQAVWDCAAMQAASYDCDGMSQK
jgi:hypothetical protein